MQQVFILLLKRLPFRNQLMLSRWLFIVAACYLSMACAPSGTQRVSIEGYSWVTLKTNGEAVARHIHLSSGCPDVVIDGRELTMQPRAAEKPDGFDAVTSCESPVPASAKQLSINGTPLPIPNSDPKKIAIIGDTGCRMKGGDFQNCNNAEGLGDSWLFERLANQLAKEKPDLIIHVGDYHYREAPCPEGNAGCANSPYGYEWDTWRIDFFDPARRLLATAPWIMSRGNHEDCSRAWKGWFYLLDALPINDDLWTSCPKFTQPYAVPVNDLQIINMDTATIPHSYTPPADPDAVDEYRKQFNHINQMAASKKTWIATHQPVWGVASYLDDGAGKLSSVDFTLQDALKQTTLNRFSANISLLVAGHIHLYEFLKFGDGRPPVMVVGGSGTELDPPITQSLIDAESRVFSDLGLNPIDFSSHAEISYVMLTRDGHRWRATLHGLEDEIESFPVSSHE